MMSTELFCMSSNAISGGSPITAVISTSSVSVSASDASAVCSNDTAHSEEEAVPLHSTTGSRFELSMLISITFTKESVASGGGASGGIAIPSGAGGGA